MTASLLQRSSAPLGLSMLGCVLVLASACSSDATVLTPRPAPDEPDDSGTGGTSSLPDDDEPAPEPPTSRGRLFVRVSVPAADGSDEVVSRIDVIDLDDGDKVGELDVAARIFPDSRAQFGVLNESTAEARLRYVDPGVQRVGSELVKSDPQVLPYETPSRDVLNVHVGSEFVGVFSEIGALAHFIDTRPLPDSPPEVVTIDRNDGLSLVDAAESGEERPFPSTGQAAQWGDSFFVSIVSAGDPVFTSGPLPVGLQRFSRSGEPLEEYPDCAGLGFAATDEYAAFNCPDGILELRRTASGMGSRRIPYPGDLTDCYGSVGAAEAPALLVECSNAETFAFMDLFRLDVQDRTLATVPGSAGRWVPHMIGDAAAPEEFAYLERATGDVVIHRLSDGAEVRRAEGAVAPFPEFPVSWSTVSGSYMYVGFVASNAPEGSDAVNEIVEVELTAEPPVVRRRFPLEGVPGRIEVLGAIR